MFPESWRASPTVCCWAASTSSMSSGVTLKVSTRAYMSLLSVDVQVDTEEEQRPEYCRKHCGADRPERVDVRLVVVHSRCGDSDDEIDDGDDVDAGARRRDGGCPGHDPTSFEGLLEENVRRAVPVTRH